MVEQAIGIVSQLRGCDPRAAFEQLRLVSRWQHRQVHALAREVVASVLDESSTLATELAP